MTEADQSEYDIKMYESKSNHAEKHNDSMESGRRRMKNIAYYNGKTARLCHIDINFMMKKSAKKSKE